jgi:hypothetical protein
MLYKDFLNLMEAKKKEDDSGMKLYKYTTFDWIIDLLKDGVVYSYDVPSRFVYDDYNYWIAMTTKKNSKINQMMPEYGPCEITFDRQLLKEKNELYSVKFDPDWLDKRPSILLFLTRGRYASSKDYFRENYKNVNWLDPDNYSKRFFEKFLNNGELDVEKLLKLYPVSEIENYIYDPNYIPFDKYLRSFGDDNELVLVKSPLRLVNDAVLQIVVPRRYKDKIMQFESEYKIRYE